MLIGGKYFKWVILIQIKLVSGRQVKNYHSLPATNASQFFVIPILIQFKALMIGDTMEITNAQACLCIIVLIKFVALTETCVERNIIATIAMMGKPSNGETISINFTIQPCLKIFVCEIIKASAY